jgi:release factor glutamine methyltransferase
MTLRDWLAQAESQLSAGPHPDRAKPDAETLLLHLIGKNKAWLMAHAEDDFAGCTAIRYSSMIERRRKGEPIQYITGETEFYGLPFRVTPDVLIPRPETEILVERVGTLVPLFPKPRIVDVGTGSGAIAIALAHDWPCTQISAIDVSNSALDLAMSNARRTGFADQIRFLHGDLLAPVKGETFDMIVSNPPYVPAADRNSLSVEVRDHEPAVALFAGIDGLEIYRRLIPAAFAALAPGGFLALEIGFGQPPAIDSLLIEAGFSDIQFTPDLQGISRVAVARRL